jgi:LysM repeat protein
MILPVVLIMSACQRSASQVPIATPTNITLATPAGSSGLPTMNATVLAFYGTETLLAEAPGQNTPQTIGTLPTTTPIPPLGTGIAATSLPTSSFPSSSLTTSLPTTGFPTTPIATIVYATPVLPTTYTLQSGEWPYCIARRYNVDQTELYSLNNLTDNAILQPGTVLQLPQTGDPFIGQRTLIPHPATYTVSNQANGDVDTIYSIACAYGDVYPEVIAQANDLSAPYTLTVGQTLTIP